MPRFQYEAITNTGVSVSNTEEADSRAELITKLKVRGYWPTLIEQSELAPGDSVNGTTDEALSEGTSGFSLQSILSQFTLRRIKSKEVEFVTYQMATLVNAHIPLVRSLEITLNQVKNPRLRSIIEQIKYDVEHGSTLADALAQHPKQFSDLYTSMIRAGEASGGLGEVLHGWLSSPNGNGP